ncbi:hypothetical protein EJ08DRAFT_738030 [Tothia fuscella]|uniref:Uncharacterized protein n=1 Tax=Tothia fuscella TaxID=1048955 RepID=A0A9P4NHQ9_9PEZI|nr:hypothetical protein EJ08DRAFT_738030 [Tothia fuscella]
MGRRLLGSKKRKRNAEPYVGPPRQPGRPRKKFPITTVAASIPKSNLMAKSRSQPEPEPPAMKKIKIPKRKPLKLSLLETLPSELLQTIFLQSMNVSLPRLSKILSSKLSSQHLHLEMSMQILYHHHDQPVKYRSQLLICKFFTLDFLAKYIQYAHRYWYDSTDHDPGDSYQELGPSEALTELEHNNLGYPFLERLQHLYIPSKLLHGPWNRQKIKFLRILKRNECTINWSTSSDDETAKRGVLEAILANCTPVVQILVGYKDSWVPVSQDMLRCAVLEGGCNRDIVRHLFDPLSDVDVRPKEELDFMDAGIWRWIEQRGDDLTGKWLQKVLESNGDSLYVRPPRRK